MDLKYYHFQLKELIYYDGQAEREKLRVNHNFLADHPEFKNIEAKTEKTDTEKRKGLVISDPLGDLDIFILLKTDYKIREMLEGMCKHYKSMIYTGSAGDFTLLAAYKYGPIYKKVGNDYRYENPSNPCSYTCYYELHRKIAGDSNIFNLSKHVDFKRKKIIPQKREDSIRILDSSSLLAFMKRYQNIMVRRGKAEQMNTKFTPFYKIIITSRQPEKSESLKDKSIWNRNYLTKVGRRDQENSFGRLMSYLEKLKYKKQSVEISLSTQELTVKGAVPEKFPEYKEMAGDHYIARDKRKPNTFHIGVIWDPNYMKPKLCESHQFQPNENGTCDACNRALAYVDRCCELSPKNHVNKEFKEKIASKCETVAKYWVDIHLEAVRRADAKLLKNEIEALKERGPLDAKDAHIAWSWAANYIWAIGGAADMAGKEAIDKALEHVDACIPKKVGHYVFKKLPAKLAMAINPVSLAAGVIGVSILVYLNYLKMKEQREREKWNFKVTNLAESFTEWLSTIMHRLNKAKETIPEGADMIASRAAWYYSLANSETSLPTGPEKKFLRGLNQYIDSHFRKMDSPRVINAMTKNIVNLWERFLKIMFVGSGINDKDVPLLTCSEAVRMVLKSKQGKIFGNVSQLETKLTAKPKNVQEKPKNKLVQLSLKVAWFKNLEDGYYEGNKNWPLKFKLEAVCLGEIEFLPELEYPIKVYRQHGRKITGDLGGSFGTTGKNPRYLGPTGELIRKEIRKEIENQTKIRFPNGIVYSTKYKVGYHDCYVIQDRNLKKKYIVSSVKSYTAKNHKNLHLWDYDEGFKWDTKLDSSCRTIMFAMAVRAYGAWTLLNSWTDHGICKAEIPITEKIDKGEQNITISGYHIDKSDLKNHKNSLNSALKKITGNHAKKRWEIGLEYTVKSVNDKQKS